MLTLAYEIILSYHALTFSFVLIINSINVIDMRRTNKVFQQLVAQLLLSCFLLESCSTPTIQIQPKTDTTRIDFFQESSVKESYHHLF